jgi:hypothetical protein
MLDRLFQFCEHRVETMNIRGYAIVEKLAKKHADA